MNIGLNIKRLDFKINIHLKRVSGYKKNFAIVKGRQCLAATRKLLVQRKEGMHQRVSA